MPETNEEGEAPAWGEELRSAIAHHDRLLKSSGGATWLAVRDLMGKVAGFLDEIDSEIQGGEGEAEGVADAPTVARLIVCGIQLYELARTLPETPERNAALRAWDEVARPLWGKIMEAAPELRPGNGKAP